MDLPDLMAVDEVEWPGLELDVVFCALPHATSQEIIKGILHATGHGFIDEMIVESPADYANAIHGSVKVVDLSADFRLRDQDVYEQWYGDEHRAPELQKEAVLWPDGAEPGGYRPGAAGGLSRLLSHSRLADAGAVVAVKSDCQG